MTDQPIPDPTATPPELVEAVARAIVAPEALDDPFVGRRVAEAAARAAIAAVRAFDLDRAPYAERTDDGTVTLRWPRGRAAAVWISAELLQGLADLMAEHDARSRGDVRIVGRPAVVAIHPDALDPAPASPGVPRCHGRVAGARPIGDDSDPCTLPLGHHGGCR